MPKRIDDEVRALLDDLVSMTPRELEAWHATDRSKIRRPGLRQRVSIGAGQRTIQLLRIKRAPSADDIRHMRRVISYIRRQQTCTPPATAKPRAGATPS